MFKSTDGGGHWSAANTGLTTMCVNALAIDPQTPSTLYAGTVDAGVFKSTDGGGHWSAANTGLTTMYVRALAIDPQTPSTLYAGTEGGGAYEVQVPAATTTTITSVQPEPSVIGQAVTVHFSVASGASGTPTGNVTVSDSASAATCTATVAAGSCSMTFSAKGTRTLKATYSGDANFHGSASAPVSHMVNAPAGNRLYLPMLVR